MPCVRTPFSSPARPARFRFAARFALSAALGLGLALIGLGASTALAQRTVPVEVSNGSPIPVVMTGMAAQASASSTTVCMDVTPTCGAKGTTLPFGCFPADSLRFGASQPASAEAGDTRRRGDVVIADLELDASPGSYSPKLFESLAKGKVFPQVAICVADAATGQTILEYTLKNTLITAWETLAGSASPDGGPMDSFSLNFEEVTYSTSIGGVDVEASWKIEPAAL